MPHYHFKKSPEGTTRLERVDSETAMEQEVPTPSGPELAGPTGGVVVHRCMACAQDGEPRDFKMPAQLARHFNSTHDELMEDSDSWREFHSEVTLN